MRFLPFALMSVILSACSFHHITTIRENETVEVVEVVPTSLPEDPGRAPAADQVSLILRDLKELGAAPGTIYREPTCIVLRASPGEPELRLNLSQVRAIHFTNVTSQELSRQTESTSTLTTGGAFAIALVAAVTLPIVIIAATYDGPQIDIRF